MDDFNIKKRKMTLIKLSIALTLLLSSTFCHANFLSFLGVGTSQPYKEQVEPFDYEKYNQPLCSLDLALRSSICPKNVIPNTLDGLKEIYPSIPSSNIIGELEFSRALTIKFQAGEELLHLEGIAPGCHITRLNKETYYLKERGISLGKYHDSLKTFALNRAVLLSSVHFYDLFISFVFYSNSSSSENHYFISLSCDISDIKENEPALPELIYQALRVPLSSLKN